MAKITLQELSKSYQGVRAVDQLSLEIAEGEFVTLLGPSGCGKSTTLYCIAGLEEPTSGLILFDDQPVNDLPPRDRNIAMVFQDYALYPHKNVFDNIAFALQLRHLQRADIEQRVREVARLLGLQELLHRRPAELSGGQRQRVALGRAIARQAVAFLMDEPLSNLDAALRVNTRTEIKKLQQELGTTTIFVTHDQEEAMVLSDRIAVLAGGVLQQYSTPEEIYNRPGNRFVAGFIGSPKMNFLDGQLGHQNGRTVVTLSDQETALTIAPPGVPRMSAGHSAPTITVGIRPEDIKVLSTPGHVSARIALMEPVGPVTYVDLDLPGQRIKASIRPDTTFSVGQEVGLQFDTTKFHLFATTSGERLA
jgi:multiple sugar transport system ATP-binding protein